MKSDPKVSEGARLERKAMRAKLTRMLKRAPDSSAVAEMLTFVLSRQKRYDKATGGLGKR